MKKIQQFIPISMIMFGLIAFTVSPTMVSAQRDYSYNSYGSNDYYGNVYSTNSGKKYKRAHYQGQFVRRLPQNAERFRMGQQKIYSKRGVFYKKVRRGYVVIPAPIGLHVKRVPNNARRIDIGRSTYYEANGTYYLDVPRRRYYEIVPRPTRRARQVSGRNRGRNNSSTYECRPAPRRR